ncbi:lasso peptide biosynthesis B2 protein [Asticcacaulis endophyticus]|nr:lasso peptide biosynthesis B2 protein [Asticcacaulis endophyticus]
MAIMSYSPATNLHYCEIGERLVFLDVQADRYFQLTPPLKTAFLDIVAGRDTEPNMLQQLVSSGVLVSQRQVARATTMPMSVTESLTESHTRERGDSCAWIEVAYMTGKAILDVKTIPLFRLLAGCRTDISQAPTCKGLIDTALDFNETRRLVPLKRVCLHDSLAMKRYLQKRRLACHLVFGVALNPFSAHCWLQAGTTVLNDTLDRAVRHTPILTV